MERNVEQIKKDIKNLKEISKTSGLDFSDKILYLEEILKEEESKKFKSLTPYEKVSISRDIKRPTALDYINRIVSNFIELHGDRGFADDKAIVGGIGKIGKYSVTVIGNQKGNSTEENIYRNFGMANPEGYRKALRLMKQAEKFNRPIITFIDTSGAYCGIGAEERGQGEAIARNLFEMSQLKTPIIAGVIGEGGSGGALALGVADKVFMQEHAVYSVLSPEGFASILWKDASRAKEAAAKMKMTAQDLLKYDVIDDIVMEPTGGAHQKPEVAADMLKQYISGKLKELKAVPIDELVEKRYDRFRKIGMWKNE